MKKLLTCIALGFATTSYAVTPLWMRDVQISPAHPINQGENSLIL